MSHKEVVNESQKYFQSYEKYGAPLNRTAQK